MKQLLLNKPGCSGRAVRYRVLDITERGQILDTVAKEIGPDGSMLELRRREEIDGVCAMVCAVTDKSFANRDALLAAGPNAGWQKVNFQELATNRAKYFTTKDMAALGQAFRKLHDATDKEVEDILGEALDVTED